MLSIEPDIQNLVKKSASLLLNEPMLTILQAMHASQFLDAQSKHPAMGIRVCRYLSKQSTQKASSSIVSAVVDTSSPMPTLSTLSSQPPTSAVLAISSTPNNST